ncbi:WD40 repeat domain-containing serine/threonine protein kinase [Nonomuraea sp. NPDC049646]|uniref:WD40 repeat domain-containing serine/threonine protein kinase n=1 Tax=unclassified Nonomuraea TaxID=2593643 RepID=UPI00379C624B
MGQVFLGRSPGGRPVAVKLVRPDLADDPGFRRRFALEAEAARRVGGFCTAQLVDADPQADPPWLVTAYVPRPSLQQAVDAHGPMPTEAGTVLGAGPAEGLGAIHACGLVHRDLKPSNVILAADAPRLIDFGIARALDDTSHTLSHAVVGTPSFMSPEQARGREIGPPSDVFSLGLVAVAFSPDGATLAVADKDGIRLWDAATGRAKATVTDRRAAALAFHPDGTSLVSGGWFVDAEGCRLRPVEGP